MKFSDAMRDFAKSNNNLRRMMVSNLSVKLGTDRLTHTQLVNTLPLKKKSFILGKFFIKFELIMF